MDNRSHLDEKLTWDLSTVYATDEVWEEEYASLNEKLSKGVESGHVLKSAKSLLEHTQNKENTYRAALKLYNYAHMKNDQDTTVPKYQEMYAKAASLMAKHAQCFSFYDPEFMEADRELLERFMQEEPKLSVYRHHFEEKLAHKEHILSKENEELLANAEEIFASSHDLFSVLDNSDMSFGTVQNEKGEEIELTHSNYGIFMESQDRKVRKNAYTTLYSAYKKFNNTYAKILQTHVKSQNFNAKVRKYSSAREAALSQNFIPERVYDTLIETVHKHLPLLHRYVELRKKLLKLSDIEMYDLYVPLSSTDIKFSYEESVAKAREVLSVYGKEYLDIVNRSFDERWIDVYPNKGKRSGAYSSGMYDTNAFMLLNWQDTLDNLYTLVHEVGHSMHSTFTHQNQPYVYGDYSIFLAEIASTTNENILTQKLLSQMQDDHARFAIINQFLDGFRATVFRQTQFAEFEYAIHQTDKNGEVLTAEYMQKLYGEINEEYYRIAPKKDAEVDICYEWSRIPHFYYNFYVYQYATGFCAALAFSEKILGGRTEDIEKYLGFLKSGCSDYSLEIIRKAGVDMEKSDYLEAAFSVFARRLDELEELAKKLGYIE